MKHERGNSTNGEIESDDLQEFINDGRDSSSDFW
jgi:hypothetical protein